MVLIFEWVMGFYGFGVILGIVDVSDFYFFGSEYLYVFGVYGDEYSIVFEYFSGKILGFVGELL